jgi:hypothetical protein
MLIFEKNGCEKDEQMGNFGGSTLASMQPQEGFAHLLFETAQSYAKLK